MSNKLKIINDMMFCARLSFIVYIKYIIINIIAFCVMGVFFFFAGLSAGAFKLIITLASIVYWFFVILGVERVKIYANKQGIWAFYGVFPWQKRVDKIEWSNLEEAHYVPSIIGWILQSYTIKLESRLLNEHEIVIPYVWRGKQFIEKINHARLAKAHPLEVEDQQ